MFIFHKKNLFILFFISSLNFYCQDSIRYRSTSIQLSVSHFSLISPRYPQANGFFPAGALSLKSSRTDSLYAPLKKFNFMITMGAAASRFLLSDEVFFKNFLDKSPLPVFSKRFWGGFGINYRRAISNQLILDIDVAPCIQIIVDKSEETRTDTSSWESRGFEDIYEGLHFYTNIKMEYRTKGNYAFFFTASGSFPLLNRFVNNGDEKYHDTFKGQFFIGIGMTHFYKSKRIIETDDKPKERF